MGCMQATDRKQDKNKKDKPPPSPKVSNKLDKYKVPNDEAKQSGFQSISLKQVGKNLSIFDFDNKPLSLVDYYRYPDLFVKLYVQRPTEFLYFLRENPHIDLAYFTGYECLPEIILKNRRSVSTYHWNVFTFSLIRDQEDLYKFIVKGDYGINVGRLVPIETIQIHQVKTVTRIQEVQEDSDEENLREDEIQEEAEEEKLKEPFKQNPKRKIQEPNIMNTLILMIENDSSLFASLINDMHYLFQGKHLLKLLNFILRNDNKEKNLKIILTSKPFIQLFYSKVTSIDVIKNSFSSFYQEYLNIFDTDKTDMLLLFNLLKEQPYSLTFGIFLMQNIQKYKPKIPDFEGFFKQLKFKKFELHRVGYIEQSTMDALQNTINLEIHPEKQEIFNNFLNTINQFQTKKHHIEDTFQTIFDLIKQGDLHSLKKKIDKYSPYTLAFITRSSFTNKEIPSKEVDMPLLKTSVKIPLKNLNPITYSCIYSRVKKGKEMITNPCTKYFLDELKLNSRKDLQIVGEGVTMENHSFLITPMLEENTEILQILLKNHHLWTYQDFMDMLIYLKQIRWVQGFKCFLDSEFATQEYLNRDTEGQKKFIKDMQSFPLRKDNDMEQDSLNQSNGMNQIQKIQLRSVIHQRLSKPPYHAGWLFSQFQEKGGSILTLMEEKVIPEALSEKLSMTISCMKSLKDDEVHLYIVQSKGQIVKQIRDKIEKDYSKTNLDPQLQLLSEQHKTLLVRCEFHPSYKEYRDAKDLQWYRMEEEKYEVKISDQKKPQSINNKKEEEKKGETKGKKNLEEENKEEIMQVDKKEDKKEELMKVEPKEEKKEELMKVEKKEDKKEDKKDDKKEEKKESNEVKGKEEEKDAGKEEKKDDKK